MKFEKGISICLMVLMMIGFILRLHNLGCYSLFASDDAVTAISIKGIINHGYPILPSGKLYLKELFYSYPTAWLCKIFGMNEFTLRIFNIPFSVGLILLVYLLGKELFGKGVGLLSAAIITFASWELEFTRYVRSYILVQFLFILSAYLFFKAFIKEERINKILLFTLFYLTVLTSFLGSILLMAFLSLWLIQGKKVFRASTMGFVFLFAIALIVSLLIFGSFADALVIVQTGKTYSFLSMIKGMPSPQFQIFSHLIVNHPVLRYLMLAVCILTAFYILHKLLTKAAMTKPKSQYFLLLSIIILILFDLPEIGILIFCSYIIITKSKIRDFNNKPIIISLLILFIGTLWWFFYGVFFWKGISLTKMKDLSPLYDVVRHLNLFNFPSLTYYHYLFMPFPKMSIMVAIGLCLLYLKVMRNENRQEAIFLGSLFVGSILFMPFPIQHSLPRYSILIYPLFILIYAFIILEIIRWLSAYSILVRLPKRLTKAALLVFFLFFTLEHANPIEAYNVVNVSYGQPVIHPCLATSPFLTHFFDYKSAGNYVREHLKEDDIVAVAFERFVLYVYIGRVDYVIFFSETPIKTEVAFGEKNSPKSDPWLKNGYICNLEALENFLNKNIKEGKTVWIVTPNYSRPQGKQRGLVYENINIYKDFFDFLKNHSECLVYVAKDNLTEVYKFAPDNYHKYVSLIE